MSEIINKIFENGAKEEFPANHSISLSDPSALLFLEKGSINLFAIERKEGKAEGQRTLIVTLEAPAPLFGFSMEAQSPLEIVAITEQPSCLWRVALSRVENDIDRDPTFIFAWINALAASYKTVICKDQQI